MATRRSHVVRVYDKAEDGSVNKARYVDVEVLDAISFKIARGKEVVLNFPAKNASPFITDDTGNDLAKSPSRAQATRRSHVELIKGKDGQLLVEVLDGISFKDTRGEEWILNMPSKKSAHYNVTTGKGDSKSTMRTHNEKIGADPTEKDPDASYLTVERSDTIAFRTIQGREMILKMPSNDKGGSPGRADTYVWSPKNYDPSNDDVEPPENKDPDFYVKFVKDQTPFTGDELISQGPLWWIRKVSAGSWVVVTVKIHRENTLQSYSVTTAGADGKTYNGWETNGEPKQMPFDKDKSPAFKPDNLDLKKDLILRGNTNAITGGGTTDGGAPPTLPDFTSLIFLNATDGKKVSIDLKFQGFQGGATGGDKVGYYMWATAVGGTNDDGAPPLVLHPPPDASNAFSPYPFDDWIGAHVGTYIDWTMAAWNVPGFPDFIATDTGVYPPLPTSAFGWETQADAERAIALLNQAQAIDHDPKRGATGEYGIMSLLVIDFGADPTAKKPKLVADITAMHYIGQTNYPYESDNTLDFPKPKLDKDIKTTTVTQTQPGAGTAPDQTVTITLDTDGTLSIT